MSVSIFALHNKVFYICSINFKNYRTNEESFYLFHDVFNLWRTIIG